MLMTQRKSRTSAKAGTPQEPDPFEKLLADLTEHGLNIFLGPPLWERLASHGPSALSALLERTGGDKPFKLVDLALQRVLEGIDPDLRGQAAYILEQSLERGVPQDRRIAAIRGFSHTFGKDPRCHDRLLNIALDPTEETLVRTAALRTLARMEPRGAQAERLLAILDPNQEHWGSPDPDPEVAPRDEEPAKARVRALAALTDAAFSCLRQHAPRISTRSLLRGLEPFLTHRSARLRTRAIELVGAAGDVDMLENLFALPDAPSHRAEILDAVAAIGSRPINLLSLRPEAFEAFVGRLLKWMGFLDVEVTRYSGDGGVDAICYQLGRSFRGVERQKWVVQCKRYSSTLIDLATLHQFAETVLSAKAHSGLFVTTSDFTKDAREFGNARMNIQLISGKELIAEIAEFPGIQRYCIPPHGSP